MRDEDEIWEMAICRRPEYRPRPGQPTLWESPVRGERRGQSLGRHQQARLLCQRCPAWDSCEARLSDSEQAGIYVDGVVAARYSDVYYRYASPVQRQQRLTECRGCAVPLAPQKKSIPVPEGARRHIGEGLCPSCWQIMSRQAHSHTQRRAA